MRRVGSQCVVLAIDAVRRGDGRYEVVTAGGTRTTGLDVIDWARRGAALGAGTRSGYDNSLYRQISDAVSLPLIASGGAGTREHFRDAIVTGGVAAVLAASLFHFGEIEIGDLKRYLAEQVIPVHER